MRGQCSRRHTSQQWESHRCEITRLYATQNISLKHVVEIMQIRHSFSATERQYKNRITQWGLDKKVKHNEMSHIVRKVQRRKAEQGKEAHFRVRKRDVDPKKITRFMRAYPRLQYSESTSPTPSVISYSTIKRAASEVMSVPEQSVLTSNSVPEGVDSISDSDALLDSHSLQNSAPGITLDSGPSNNVHFGDESSINENQELASTVFKVPTQNERRPNASVSSLTAMKEFFDFSAAAKTTIKSASSSTQITSFGEKSMRPGILNGSKIEDTVSVVESENYCRATLNSLIELAGRVEDQGKDEWSRILLQRAVRQHRPHLGKEHPNTLEALEALSRILRRQGRDVEAERLLSGALKAFRRTGGEKQSDTLDCLGLLALVMMDQGRYVEAEALARRALDIRLQFLDHSDPGVSRSKEKLGIVLSSLGRHKAAEKLHREVLAERSQSLGKDHQKTLNSMHNLAISLDGQGNYKAMESIYESMISIQGKTIGPHHPHTLNSMHGVATALGGQKRYEEAETKYRAIIKLRRSVSGDEHPHTLTSMHNLAGVLRHQGRHCEAKTIYEQVLEIERRALGDEHPSTLTTQANLASVLEDLGEDDEAEAMCRLSFLLRQKVLGSEHPSTLTSKSHLARLLEDKGEYQAALSLYCEVLVARQKLLDIQHPLTNATLRRVGIVEQLIRDDSGLAESDEGLFL